MNMDALRAQLIRHEGLRLKPYMDTTAHITIGVGRNLTDVGISATEAMQLLDNDISRTLMGIRPHISWWDALSEVRQRVLVDMAFNLGPEGLLKWTNTLQAVSDGDYQFAAKAMRQSLWARQVGKRALDLALMMESGEDIQ